MASPKTRLTLGALMLAASAPAILAAQPAPHADTAPDPAAALSAETRAGALVKAITRDEKLQLVHGLFPPRAAGKGAKNELIPSAGHIDGIRAPRHPAAARKRCSAGRRQSRWQRKGDAATALCRRACHRGDLRSGACATRPGR